MSGLEQGHPGKGGRGAGGDERGAGAVSRADGGVPVSGGAARVTLYGKPGCHLCDDAREVIAAVCSELGVGWTEIDIRSDEELFRRYAEQIPVTFVDGEQHDFWRVDPTRLRTALS